MNRLEAHELLDKQKNQRGFSCLSSEIDRALWVCGDTRTPFAMSGKRVENPLHETNESHWQAQSIYMVERDHRINGEEAWEAICG